MTTGEKAIKIMVIGICDQAFQAIAAHLVSIKADIQLIHHTENTAYALELSAEICPHIFLLGISAPGIDGVELSALLHKACPDARLIVLSPIYTTDLILALMESGANAVLLSTAPLDDLVHVIYATYAGQIIFSPELADLFWSHNSEQSQ